VITTGSSGAIGAGRSALIPIGGNEVGCRPGRHRFGGWQFWSEPY
jgi:hypothetical protein